MRGALRPSLVLLGTAVVLVGGGSVLAAAGWISRSTSEAFTVTAAKIPQVARPTVTRTVVPVVRWRSVRIAADTPVHRYVVTRHLGGDSRIVCNQPATVRTTCIDLTAPVIGALTYTVHATHGEHWVGVDSPPSLPLDGTAEPTASSSPTPSAAVTAEPTGTPGVRTVNPRMAPSTPDEPVESVSPTTEAPTPTPTTPAPIPTQPPSDLAESGKYHSRRQHHPLTATPSRLASLVVR